MLGLSKIKGIYKRNKKIKNKEIKNKIWQFRKFMSQREREREYKIIYKYVRRTTYFPTSHNSGRGCIRRSTTRSQRRTKQDACATAGTKDMRDQSVKSDIVKQERRPARPKAKIFSEVAQHRARVHSTQEYILLSRPSYIHKCIRTLAFVNCGRAATLPH